jgi:hypothetical protein
VFLGCENAAVIQRLDKNVLINWQSVSVLLTLFITI